MAPELRSNATVPALAIRIHSKQVVVDRKPFGVLGAIDLDVQHREIVAVVGTSGAGKTSLLRAVAGLDMAYDGEIRSFDSVITGPARERGLVFQEHRLMPWMTVANNVAYSLPSSDSRSTMRDKVCGALELVGLDGFENAWPNQLSGGMSQRASLARALATAPEILLLDEPLGALDSLLRSQMQAELERLVLDQRLTAMLVTHDVDEAIVLADRVIVMAGPPGRVVAQIPVELARPRRPVDPGVQSLRSEILEHLHGQPVGARQSVAIGSDRTTVNLAAPSGAENDE